MTTYQPSPISLQNDLLHTKECMLLFTENKYVYTYIYILCMYIYILLYSIDAQALHINT